MITRLDIATSVAHEEGLGDMTFKLGTIKILAAALAIVSTAPAAHDWRLSTPGLHH